MSFLRVLDLYLLSSELHPYFICPKPWILDEFWLCQLFSMCFSPWGSKSRKIGLYKGAIELKFAGSLSLVLKLDPLRLDCLNSRPDGLFWCVFSDESCWWGARQVCECTLLFKLVFGGLKGLESPKSLNIFCSSWVEVAPQRISAPTRPWISRN